MNSTESKESRIKRVDMHKYFLDRIKKSMEEKNYITASWLIYSCFENRYFRTVQKVREYCAYCRSKSKCNHKRKNELSIKTKIKCLQRLHENSADCISESFRYELFQETIDWVGYRNTLMHDLLVLDYYEETDDMFKTCAENGLKLLNETYNSCTKFRRKFYDPKYKFEFPKAAMDGCPCRPKPKEKPED